jgi:hypothetical protein
VPDVEAAVDDLLAKRNLPHRLLAIIMTAYAQEPRPTAFGVAPGAHARGAVGFRGRRPRARGRRRIVRSGSSWLNSGRAAKWPFFF